MGVREREEEMEGDGGGGRDGGGREGRERGSTGRGSGSSLVLIDDSKEASLVICPNRSHKTPPVPPGPPTPKHRGIMGVHQRLQMGCKQKRKRAKRDVKCSSFVCFVCVCVSVFVGLQILSAQQ